MKPIIIIPPGVMSAEDQKELTDNDLCVVEATDPSQVKFLDPIPASSSRTQIEQACIDLSRIVLNGKWNITQNGVQVSSLTKTQLRSVWYECLTKGTRLDPNPTIEELEQKIIDDARMEELVKIGRE